MSETSTQPASSEAVIVAEIIEEPDVEARVDFEDDRDDEDFDDEDFDDEDFDDEDFDEEDPEDGEDEDYEHVSVVVREVIERQLIACRTLGVQVTDAATDVTATLVESPAQVISAVRDGATLPTAFGLTTDAVADAAIEAGNRIRSAVGTYVNSQSALPDALVTGFVEVAASAVRAQGAMASSAWDAAFTVATAATRDGHVLDSAEEEWLGLVASFHSARDDIQDVISVAQRRIQDALPILIGDD